MFFERIAFGGFIRGQRGETGEARSSRALPFESLIRGLIREPQEL